MTTFHQFMVYSSVSQSGLNHPFGGEFEGQRGEKNKGGNSGVKQHKGGENAQPLSDR